MVSKPKFKNIAILLTLVVLSALMLSACNTLAKSIELNYSNERAYTVAGDGEIAFASVGLGLEVSWINGGVIIDVDPTITAVRFHEVYEGENPNRDNTMRYMLDGNTLRIKYAKSGRTNIGNLQKFLYISVPDKIWFDEVEVETVSGSMMITNINANEIECSTVSGAVAVDCTANSVDVDSVSSDVTVGGNILKADIETVSGLTTINCAMSLHNLEVESTKGDVVLRILDDCGFRLNYSTITGVFINAFDEETVLQGGYYVYKSGNGLYEVETVSGKLTIEKIIAV